MLDKVFTNNQVTIAGRVVGEFGYSHTVYGEDFYTVDIEVSRLSNSNDIIPVMVSERILDVRADYRGYVLRANGQFRSYNRHVTSSGPQNSTSWSPTMLPPRTELMPISFGSRF